jgi:excinuclease ABC subunit C
LGPCVGKQEGESYEKSIEQIKAIIGGNLNEVIGYLKGEMKKHAEAYRYEDANGFKEKVEILSRYQAKSTIVNSAIHNVDVFSIVSDENEAFVNFLKVVKGAIIQAFTVQVKKKLDEDDADLLSFVIADLRSRTESKATEMIVPFDLAYLFPENRITVPRRGDKKKLLDLSERNAKSFRLEKKKIITAIKYPGSSQRILTTLQSDLRLSELPMHIECFDNSNFQGSNPVAACVVFKNGKPAKKEYRHYHIKGVSGANDFASMEEVVYRRYKRLKNEKVSIPHLIIVDGGKGQLSAALQSLDRLGLRGKIAIIGIAKRLEEIFFPGDPVPLYIDKNSESLKLIQNLRNEAHRFGINFHRQLRSGDMLKSAMGEIPGVGLKSIERMYTKFKSREGIENAGEEELAKEIGLSRARLIREYFKKKE